MVLSLFKFYSVSGDAAVTCSLGCSPVPAIKIRIRIKNIIIRISAIKDYSNEYEKFKIIQFMRACFKKMGPSD